MATVEPVPSAFGREQQPSLMTTYDADVADGDDLVVPRHDRMVMLLSPQAATTTLNSISDGQGLGQELIIIVPVATNVLRIPGSLGNVDLGTTVNLDIDEQTNARLIWDGTNWRNA